MNNFKLLSITLGIVLASGCNARINQSVSSTHCSRIHESIERADCYSRTGDFNDNLRERMEKVKAEEREKGKLDFKKKRDENKIENDEEGSKPIN